MKTNENQVKIRKHKKMQGNIQKSTRKNAK